MNIHNLHFSKDSGLLANTNIIPYYELNPEVLWNYRCFAKISVIDAIVLSILELFHNVQYFL